MTNDITYTMYVRGVGNPFMCTIYDKTLFHEGPKVRVDLLRSLQVVASICP